jgi:hypothetical protein
MTNTGLWALDPVVDETDAARVADGAGDEEVERIDAAELTAADVAGLPVEAPVVTTRGDAEEAKDGDADDDAAGALAAAGLKSARPVVAFSSRIAMSPRTTAAVSSTLLPSRTEKRMSTRSS